MILPISVTLIKHFLCFFLYLNFFLSLFLYKYLTLLLLLQNHSRYHSESFTAGKYKQDILKNPDFALCNHFHKRVQVLEVYYPSVPNYKTL